MRKKTVVRLIGLVVVLVVFAELAVLGFFALRSKLRKNAVYWDGRPYTVAEIFTDPKVAQLAKAAAKDEIELIEGLIAEGVDVNSVGRFGFTPAMWAIRTDGFAGFVRLVERGASLEMTTDSEVSVLSQAAGFASDSRFLRIALQQGPDVNLVEGRTGETPLFHAVRSYELERVEMLIDAGASVNAKSVDGDTALMLAITHYRYRIACVLIDRGADPLTKTIRGADAMSFAKVDKRRGWWLPDYWWRDDFFRRVELARNRAQQGNNADP